MSGFQEYFDSNHQLIRDSVRRFVEREILPFVDEWEEAEGFPRELYLKAGAAGILGIGYPGALGGSHEGDVFAKVAASEELMRCGSAGLVASLGSLDIGLPPVVKWGQLALEQSLSWARQREAFGKPIGKFQVLKHRLAEMATQLEVSREYTYRQAAKMAAGQSVIKEISMAKNVATDTADRITYDAVQILGGSGYMRDSLVERLYRDNRILSIGGGTREVMNEIIAKQMGL
jgi:alkylation response protein AidB-like acyl-CoA dehydrogenase